MVTSANILICDCNFVQSEKKQAAFDVSTYVTVSSTYAGDVSNVRIVDCVVTCT